MRALLVVTAAVMLALSASASASGQAQIGVQAAPRDTRPAALRDVGIDQRLGGALPLDAIFQDESARAVRLGQYFSGRPVVLALAYFNCPMLCTEVLNGVVSSLKTISFDAGKQFEVVVVSFDPRDKPPDAAAKKAAYMGAYKRPGTENGWHFLTGGPGSIERLTKAIGFRYKFDESLGQFAHAAAIYVATPEGKLSRYFYGIEYAPRDLRLGLIEASESRIGTPVDQILLYCYHYDPKVGRYGAVVGNVLRLAGAATVLILASFLTIMWRRDRRADAVRDREAGLAPHGGRT
jgi:protein SCO1/2